MPLTGSSEALVLVVDFIVFGWLSWRGDESADTTKPPRMDRMTFVTYQPMRLQVAELPFKDRDVYYHQ